MGMLAGSGVPEVSSADSGCAPVYIELLLSTFQVVKVGESLVKDGRMIVREALESRCAMAPDPKP